MKPIKGHLRKISNHLTSFFVYSKNYPKIELTVSNHHVDSIDRTVQAQTHQTVTWGRWTQRRQALKTNWTE